MRNSQACPFMFAVAKNCPYEVCTVKIFPNITGKAGFIQSRFYIVIVQSITKSILLLILHCKKHRAFESLFDSDSYFLLRCNDEDWTEYDEREAESVLDKDVVKLVLLGVSKHQVDVIVGEVEEDQTG